MTAQEFYKQAFRLDQRIDSDIAEKERLREMAFKIRASGFNDHSDPNHPSEATFVRTLEKVWAMEEKINKEIDMLVDLRNQIHAVIELLSDPNERLVLRYRYLNNMTWEKISEELHAGETSVRRWHRNALEHTVLPDNTIKI